MLLLAIETSTPQSSVAIVDRDRVIASATLGIDRRHGEFVTPAVRFCLDQAGLSVTDLTGVAVGTGPGLYTGLRIGIATAQTIARARGLRVVGLSGLDVLAFGQRRTRRLVCAAIDARRGELFWAFYRAAPGGVQRQSEPCVGSPDQLAAEIEAAGEEVLLVGDAGERHRDWIRDVAAELAGIEIAWPDAAHLATLARPRFEREETDRPEHVRPCYLRQADARIGWETRRGRRGVAT